MANTGKYDELRHFWLRQLMLEFDWICTCYGVQLTPPVFEIGQSEKKLGEWTPATRTIMISQHLIVNYPWSTTLQVLKHEMAHQCCSEKHFKDDKPHGEAFQSACLALGVPLEYRHAKADLGKVILLQGRTGVKNVDKGRRLIEKVEKLLALGSSANEHEAALAIQKAHELVGKYHLEQIDGGRQARFNFVVIDKKRKRLASYQRSICMILSDFFMVKVVISKRYDPLLNDTFKTIELLGSPENIAIAEYCYFYLENKLPLLWEVYKQRGKGRGLRRQKNSFYLGVLHGFYSHLSLGKSHNNEMKHVEPGTMDLVKVKDQMLKEYVRERFPTLGKSAKRRVMVCRDHYAHGLESGKEIRFTQGIDRNTQRVKGLLQHEGAGQ